MIAWGNQSLSTYRRISAEMIKKIFMVATVIVLALLIIITPTFISQSPPPASVPRVLIDNLSYAVIVDVNSALEPYRYRNITIAVRGLDNLSYHPPPVYEEQTYDLHVVVLKNVSRKFDVNITLYDRARYAYDYNVTIEVSEESNQMLVRNADGDVLGTVSVGGNAFKDAMMARSVS